MSADLYKIEEKFTGVSRVEMGEEILRLRAKLAIEKAECLWLDSLADDLRNDEDTEQTQELEKDYSETVNKVTDELRDTYNIIL